MNQMLPDDEKLFEDALDLIIRLQNDPSNATTLELIRRWRARGPAYEAIWAEVSEIHGMAGQILTEQHQSDRSPATASRRTFLIGGAAALASAGGATLYGPGAVTRLQADHATGTAELRRVALADGSFVTLGPDSAVRTTFTASDRMVELLEGMAFFEVARDTLRPFRAKAEQLVATAIGTAFDMTREAGLVTVSVHQGLVGVTPPGSGPATVERLAEGDWLSLTSSTLRFERGRREGDQIAAWRDGMLIAERESVATLVARIGRWYAGRIMIADPSFGQRHVSGVFDLHSPIAALEAVVHPHGGRVRQLSPWLTIVSRI